jgi:diguanylate cyclase (GGDEF)-like protein
LIISVAEIRKNMADHLPKVLRFLESQSNAVILLEGLMLIATIGLLDFVTGDEIAFSVFYVLPISLIAWFVNSRLGLLASTISAVVWLGADVATHDPYSNQFIPVWNSLIRLAFFVIITFLLSALRKALQRESDLARIDHLTGAANSRYFHDVAQLEIDRCQRYQRPFTLAYVDLDNFKTVNDQLGHVVGDRVLRTVVESLKSQLRKTDFVARLGGDEFIVLFPETTQDAARHALTKIQGFLADCMRREKWPITFSIGVLTCGAAPGSSEDLLRMADELMYAAKNDGKNKVRYGTYAAPDHERGIRDRSSDFSESGAV